MLPDRDPHEATVISVSRAWRRLLLKAPSSLRQIHCGFKNDLNQL